MSFQANELIAELVQMFMDSLSGCTNSKKEESSLAEDLADVRQSRNGNSDAYRRLIERHQAHVGQILWRFSRDRRVHEELIQDAFVQAYLSLGSYRAKGPFAHWLSRIATRVGYRYWKQAARQSATESFSLQEWDQVVAETVEHIEPSQAGAAVHRLMAQLSPRDRLVLTLRYLDQCDVTETAKRTGWSKTMVKVQTWRAVKRLEKLFDRDQKDVRE